MENTQDLQQTLGEMYRELNFPDLFRTYTWERDTWSAGFPDMFRLETEISAAARAQMIRKDHLVKIARWGKLPNISRIRCPDPVKISLYENDLPAQTLVNEPQTTIWNLQGQISGFGPTYLSKLLHFAVPQICGALDTRLVRIFGKDAPQYHLLDLYVRNDKGRYYIPAIQAGWPWEYGTWVKILNSTATFLNSNRIPCPHPSAYLEAGLRIKDEWLPADVETALFSYASKELGKP